MLKLSVKIVSFFLKIAINIAKPIAASAAITAITNKTRACPETLSKATAHLLYL